MMETERYSHTTPTGELTSSDLDSIPEEELLSVPGGPEEGGEAKSDTETPLEGPTPEEC